MRLVKVNVRNVLIVLWTYAYACACLGSHRTSSKRTRPIETFLIPHMFELWTIHSTSVVEIVPSVRSTISRDTHRIWSRLNKFSCCRPLRDGWSTNPNIKETERAKSTSIILHLDPLFYVCLNQILTSCWN